MYLACILLLLSQNICIVKPSFLAKFAYSRENSLALHFLLSVCFHWKIAAVGVCCCYCCCDSSVIRKAITSRESTQACLYLCMWLCIEYQYAYLCVLCAVGKRKLRVFIQLMPSLYACIVCVCVCVCHINEILFSDNLLCKSFEGNANSASYSESFYYHLVGNPISK